MTSIGLAVGVNVRGGASLAAFGPLLDGLAALGYTHAELSAKSLAVIVGGALQPVRLAALTDALADRPVRLTLHASAVSSPVLGNLMDVTSPVQHATMAADIALAAAIGAETLVYHSGMLGITHGDDDAVARGMAAERDALRAFGDAAGAHGIRIAVENVHPTATRLDHRAYGYRLERLGEQVAAVDHPQVGICLDTGHGFLSSRYYGFDYLAGVRAIAPLVNHLHLTDNLGRPLVSETADPDESLVRGDGDLHLPPGWGIIPLAGVFATPFPRGPMVTLEMKPAFHPHAAEALAATRALLALAPATTPVGE